MKRIYECEICGKTSQSYIEISDCEASDLGLTKDKYAEYKKLVNLEVSARHYKARTKTAKADEALNAVIAVLIAFEKEHNIEHTLRKDGKA